MFCDSQRAKDEMTLPCYAKGISELISFLSLIFLTFVMFISIKKLKSSFINKLILQIIFSEIFDSINILLAVVMDSFKDKIFENYNHRMSICFTQLYLGVFTLLLTLLASLFMSLKLYDIIIKKNKIFKKGSFLDKYTHLLTIFITCFISMIFWVWQVASQSNGLRNKSYGEFYSDPVYPHFRHIYCFYGDLGLYVLVTLCTLLIICNFYLSIYSVIKIKKTRNQFIADNDTSKNSIQKNIKKMNDIKNSLIYYPIASGLIWIIFFIIHFKFLHIRMNDLDQSIFAFVCYSFLVSTRGLIYIFGYLYTQNKIREYVINTLICKKTKDKSSLRTLSEIRQSIGSSSSGSLMNGIDSINDDNSEKLK